MKDTSKHCGIVALLGEPNVGKSTLINALIGTKISIVTHKAQTTRERIRGIIIEGNTQIVLIDTPGIFFSTKSRLDKVMVSSAWGGASDSDIILFMLEAHRGLSESARSILKTLGQIKNNKSRIALVINKIDRVKREQLLILAENLNTAYNFDKTFMISAQKDQGITNLKKWMAENLPRANWLYPQNQLADFQIKSFAAELTREKLLLRLHQEVPYQLVVEPEDWIELPNGDIKISQNILVSNKRYKGIVLGKKGETIKWVSIASRKELVKILDKQIHLILQVRVRKNWYNDPKLFPI